MKRISTHILDMMSGKPAQGILVRLEKHDAAGDWRVLSSARSDNDGRCPEMLPEDADLSVGTYRLSFDVEDYFALQKINALYPVVEIVFKTRPGESHFHIPLLLSPNGYTTYRGS
jgi:5-hydroxyisourate hydrolase